MLIKSALRDLLSVSYGMISILQWKTIQPRLRHEVGLFSHERSPVVRFYHKRAPFINLEAPYNNPRAKGTSNFSPLRTFGPKGRQPSSPKGRQGGCMVFAAKGGIKNGAEGAVPRQRSDTI